MAGSLKFYGRKTLLFGLALIAFGVLPGRADPFDDTKADSLSKLIAKLTGTTGFTVRSSSMKPTILPGDTIIASELPYKSADPAPGDIIIFTYPTNPSVAFVSRVIAVGDTTIELRRGLTIVGGYIVREAYVPDDEKRQDSSRTLPKTRVPVGEIYVMGDDRDNSEDSRYKGFVPRSSVIGKVTKILGPTHDSH